MPGVWDDDFGGNGKVLGKVLRVFGRREAVFGADDEKGGLSDHIQVGHDIESVAGSEITVKHAWRERRLGVKVSAQLRLMIGREAKRDERLSCLWIISARNVEQGWGDTETRACPYQDEPLREVGMIYRQSERDGAAKRVTSNETTVYAARLQRRVDILSIVADAHLRWPWLSHACAMPW
jgi:hypothetical protein